MGGLKLQTYSNRGIVAAVLVFFVLSALDGVLTLWGLYLDVIQEVNPLMRLLIDNHPQLFLFLKLLVPVILGVYCWWNRDTARKLVIYALVFVVGLYIIVSLFHVYWIVLYNISRL